MTSISAISVNPYALSAPGVSIKGATGSLGVSPLGPADAGTGQEKDKTLRVDTSGVNVDRADPSDGGSPIEQLKKQIEQVQKLLAKQQAELARAQKSQANAEQKAQQITDIQAQIMATRGQLQVLQAALVQAMTLSINTHA